MSMNYLQYAFYAINIYLEKVMEDFRWGNACSPVREVSRRSATYGLPGALIGNIYQEFW
jgi:hypothetical protein